MTNSKLPHAVTLMLATPRRSPFHRRSSAPEEVECWNPFLGDYNLHEFRGYEGSRPLERAEQLAGRESQPEQQAGHESQQFNQAAKPNKDVKPTGQMEPPAVGLPSSPSSACLHHHCPQEQTFDMVVAIKEDRPTRALQRPKQQGQTTNLRSSLEFLIQRQKHEAQEKEILLGDDDVPPAQQLRKPARRADHACNSVEASIAASICLLNDLGGKHNKCGTDSHATFPTALTSMTSESTLLSIETSSFRESKKVLIIPEDNCQGSKLSFATDLRTHSLQLSDCSESTGDIASSIHDSIGGSATACDDSSSSLLSGKDEGAHGGGSRARKRFSDFLFKKQQDSVNDSNTTTSTSTTPPQRRRGGDRSRGSQPRPQKAAQKGYRLRISPNSRVKPTDEADTDKKKPIICRVSSRRRSLEDRREDRPQTGPNPFGFF